MEMLIILTCCIKQDHEGNDLHSDMFYHFSFVIVFLCLGLSVVSTVDENEFRQEAESALFYLEIIVVVWFGLEFLVRYVHTRPFIPSFPWETKTFTPTGSTRSISDNQVN